MLQAIKYDPDLKKLEVLNQLELPHKETWVEVRSAEDAFDVIKRMVVRGAPAIAIVGMLGVAVDCYHTHPKDFYNYALEKLDYIVGARPTAVNLANAAEDMKKHHLKDREELINAAHNMLASDLADNRAIGNNGLSWAQKNCGDQPFSVVTICNTGSLATAGYGTALGIVRSLHEKECLKQVYALETRPYLQGARLTAYELVHDGIPATLIGDSMAASLLRKNPDIKMIVVGADRVAANGDTANKIGTYELAVVAKFHGVKFVVAAPTTSVDFGLQTGDQIRIETRPGHELTQVQGIDVAAPGINVWNPGFDVTPASLIDAIVTEKGVFTPSEIANLIPRD